MGAPDKFVAQILETSARGYAGLAASLLFDRDADFAGRYEPDGFANWKEQLNRWVLDLSAAVEAGEPGLFVSRMVWTRKAFASRNVPVEDLAASLAALKDTLAERLPENSIQATVPTVEKALEALADPDIDDESFHSGPPASRETLEYLEKILEGHPRRAIDKLLAAVDGGKPARDVYLDVLIPAQREVGRMWHDGELTIAEEHVITATTKRAMALLCEKTRPSSERGKSVVLSCVAGNVHDIGIRAIADFFEMAGWRAINLGPDVPDGEIARSVQLFDADVLILAATLDPHLRAMQRTIERVREIKEAGVKVIVGGPVFDSLPDLWEKIGADGYAAGVEDAEPLASELAG